MRLLILVCFSLLSLSFAVAQTTLNPDISLVGDIRIFSHGDETRPNEKERLNLADPQMELVVAGYLNPYVRADATIAWEGEHSAEIEELYMTGMRGMPLGLNIRAGKYRLEFGRLNPVHPHAYSFIFQPLPHRLFFGEEGLNDMAVRFSRIVPIGSLYTEISGAVLKGEAITAGHHDHEHEDEEEAEGEATPGFMGRLTGSASVSDNAEMALGMSAVTTKYDLIDDLRATVLGFDLKYKWKPTRYRAFQFEAEGLLSRREIDEGETIESMGGYAYFDYRFRQKFNAGAIMEYAQEPAESDHNLRRWSVFLGYAPVEETSLLRLVAGQTKPAEGESFWEVTLQAVFSLGPHQPHNF